MNSEAAAASAGCDNKGFEGGHEDGFQTIDLRLARRDTLPDKDQEEGCAEPAALRCGWGSLRPRWLQRYRTAKWALFWLCWAGAMQGMVVNGFVNVVITTIERRFGLRSMQTGIIAGGYDMASFLCLVPVTYLGGRGAASKPRWLGWGVLVMGAGSLLFALPHFLVAPYRAPGHEPNDLCVANRTQAACEEGAASGGGAWAVAVFVAAQLLHGAGAAPLFTLGVTYIDENVSKKMSSVYLGVYYTMAVVGPALGYVLGGQMLQIYTDFLTVDAATLGISAGSSVWVGAWWVGFLVAAALCCVVAAPLLAFPHELPGAAEIRASKVSEAHEGSAATAAAFGALRELPAASAALLRNPTFLFLNLAGASEGLLISGFAAFLPKLIENQFAVSAAQAAMLLGVITVPAGGGGTFAGGWLVKRLQLSCAGIIKLCVLASLVAAAFCCGFVLSCADQPFAGVTRPYSTGPMPGASPLVSACNAGCACGGVRYAPVCAADGRVYYSACHAACRARRTPAPRSMPHPALYSDCACVDASAPLPTYLVDEASNVSVLYEAISSSCAASCGNLWPFVALSFCVMLFTFLATMPALSATLRCVREEQRSFALGIQWIKVRLLGTIPAPLLFGYLIDLSCALWEHGDACGARRGACLLYDNLNMSRYMLALALLGKLCSVVFFFLAWWCYRAPGSQSAAPTEKMPGAGDVVTLANGAAGHPPNGYCNQALDCSEHL